MYLLTSFETGQTGLKSDQLGLKQVNCLESVLSCKSRYSRLKKMFTKSFEIISKHLHSTNLQEVNIKTL